MARELTLWGAKGPDGLVVRSSIGTFRSVAQRYALRKKNYEVVKLGSINVPYVDVTPTFTPVTMAESAPASVSAPAPDMNTQEPEANTKAQEPPAPIKRRPGRPRKVQPESMPVKRGPGRPRKAA